MRLAPGQRMLILTVTALFVLPRGAAAGTITYGGDLAPALGGSVVTPPLIDAGGTLNVPIGPVSLPLVGSIQGTVRLQNNGAASGGSVEVIGLTFQSLRPAGLGGVTFTLAVDQDFAYLGAPFVLGAHDVIGSATFTAFPQSATASGTGFIEGLGGGSFPFSLSATAGGPFPQTQPFGIVADFAPVPAAAPVNLRLTLSLSLSDNAQATGPRVDITSRVAYQTVGGVPEPSAFLLLCCGGLILLGLSRRRRRIT